MAFQGLDFFMPAVTKVGQLKGAVFELNKAMNKMASDWKKHKKTFESSKQKKVQDTLAKGFNKVMKAAGGLLAGSLDIIGVFMQFLDAMGVLRPILNILSTIFKIIGASVMETLMPALRDLYETLLSPEMMETWEEIGVIIGDFLKWLLDEIVRIFSDPNTIKMIVEMAKLLIRVLYLIAGAFGGIFEWFASMDVGTIKNLFIAFAGFLGFIIGMSMGGIMGVVAGLALATTAVIGMSLLLGGSFGSGSQPIGATGMGGMFLAEGGIVTQPTLRIIGEAGPEAVVPLDEYDGGGQETVWAIEDTNRRLDRLIAAQEEANRLKMMRYL